MGNGWLWNRRFQVVSVAALVVVSFTFVSGCSLFKKGSTGAGEESVTGTEGGLESNRLAGGSSLEQFEATGEVAPTGRYKDLHFAFDSSELDATARELNGVNAETLRNGGSQRVEIEGHCDERGTSQYNLALGARRAKQVRDDLVARGVDPSRLSTVSYGEELPLCKESTEQCWAQNRRGHLVDLTQ